jgi:beta-mannosidase
VRSQEPAAADQPCLVSAVQVRVRFSKSRASTRGFAKLKIAVPAKDVDLWWPVGYGKQPLYDLKVRPALC